jgi:hypothetical protein
MVLTLTFPKPSITARSMFFAPVCTTSNRDLTASWIVSEFDSSGFQFFSRNSRTVFEDLPIAFAWDRRAERCQYRFVHEGGDGKPSWSANLPSRKDSTRFRQVKFRSLLVVVIESDDQTTDSERPHSS